MNAPGGLTHSPLSVELAPGKDGLRKAGCMTGFTIAHLTDAHLPLHGGFSARELLGKRALSALNWARSRRALHLRTIADRLRADVMAHRPDHVAMTGDAVNFGLPREFGGAAEWLAGFGPGEQVSFVPGNHEALVAGVETERDARFAPFIASDRGAGWPWVRRRGPVALIGVSTAIATPLLYAKGAAGLAQIDGLRAHLSATRGLCRIVLIHHPPTAMSKPRKALRDRKAVAAAIAEAGADLVLHGHNHKSQLSWIDAGAIRIPVLGAPSASTPPGTGHEPAEWRLITISAEGRGHRIEILRRAVTATGEFADRGRFSLPSAS
ncbi:metallophosphoesterase [Pikeienuella piscinae]|uniref:Metallophosphoesterase n=1 Tax=Pikeienuella piscinae TaxID=2748098 RepID=A0A7L5C251_9RHOB|nr:metallophosphoesterase [Pikeienuella piscinae]QIE56907.1 metallophosphoesterase [Pikeienuella piscinae]